jgi:hypothetical protein
MRYAFITRDEKVQSGMGWKNVPVGIIMVGGSDYGWLVRRNLPELDSVRTCGHGVSRGKISGSQLTNRQR